jgi:hypothetical protein
MNHRILGSPADAGWFMPAEWWPHTRCWMAWPTQSEPRRPGLLEDVRKEVVTVARAIAEFEPVWMIASPDSAEEAAKACGDSITIIPPRANRESRQARRTTLAKARSPQQPVAAADFLSLHFALFSRERPRSAWLSTGPRCSSEPGASGAG